MFFVILSEPQFVASFEVGNYVYFFFREVALEYTNCGKRIYSRVARVCKVGTLKTRICLEFDLYVFKSC